MIHRKDFEYALLESEKVLKLSVSLEQLIAARCIIHAIKTYDLDLINSIHQIVFKSPIYPPFEAK